jgi:hypothetical protein
MNPEISTDGAPQPRPPMYIDLSFLREGEEIINVQTYRVETKKPRRWQFWAKEHIKFNFMLLTNARRLFIVDPDALTIQEKSN